MWARFTVLNETPIASAIAGWVIPLSRSNTIWMRSRCAAGIFQRSAVFSFRICFLVHLTICPPDSDSQSESYRAPPREPEKDPKPLDSISYGSGMTYWKGSSIDKQIVAEARKAAAGGSAMVVLDSNHAAAHVFQEIMAYRTLVKVGDYLIVED